MIAALLLACASPSPEAPDRAPILAPPAASSRVPEAPPPSAAAPAPSVLEAPVPGPDPATSTAFVFLGDTGKGSPGQKAVAEAVKSWCAARRCDFVAVLGDILYPKGAQTADDPIFKERFEAYWEGFDGPFMMALGNHDHYGNVEAELAYARTSKKWVQPARWYTYTRGPASFFVLDTGDGEVGKIDDEQGTWLRRELSQSTSPWRVAYGHHPMHSSGLHGGGAELTRTIGPVLESGGVQFWLCGHEHNLELIDDGSAPVEVVSGAGGDVRAVNPAVPGSVYLASSLGFGYLVLNPARAELAMVEVGAAGSRVAYRQGWDAR